MHRDGHAIRPPSDDGNASYDATIAPGGVTIAPGGVTIGFIGAGTARGAAPATFAVADRPRS